MTRMYRLLIVLILFVLVAVGGWAVRWFDDSFLIVLQSQAEGVSDIRGIKGIYVAAVVGFALIFTALGGRIWQFLSALPGRIRERTEANRKERGYQALTKGLAAIAAGDARESASLAAKSRALLKDQKLTALLSAQSAQLQGREETANLEFRALLEDEETAFLGLRGLAMQALRRNDTVLALRYVKEAQEIKPNAPWVLDLIYQLELRDGRALESAAAVRTAQMGGHITRESAQARLAPLHTDAALQALNAGDLDAALGNSAEALAAQPGFLPAVLIRARAQLQRGKTQEAKALLKRTYRKQPQPELAALFFEASDTSTPQKTKRAGHALLKGVKGRIGLRLWGEFLLEQQNLSEARVALEAAQDLGSARASRLLDEFSAIEKALTFEEGATDLEKSDAIDQAATLINVALAAPGEANWTCRACGTYHPAWALHCHSCETSGLIAWENHDEHEVVRPVTSLIERPTLSRLS